MLLFIAIYITGFLVGCEVAFLVGYMEYEWDRPVLTTLAYASTWPLFAAWYMWRGIRACFLHMVEELTP